MAIVQEHFTVNGRDFVKTYSNDNRYVVGGEPHGEYAEACDPAELGRTYIEGDYIGDDVSADEALAILLGGAT